MLIKHGADVNSTSSFEKTPVHIAAESGISCHKNIILLILIHYTIDIIQVMWMLSEF